MSFDKTFKTKTPGHAWPGSVCPQGSTEVLVSLCTAVHECMSAEQPIVDIDSVASAALYTLLTIQKTYSIFRYAMCLNISHPPLSQSDNMVIGACVFFFFNY